MVPIDVTDYIKECSEFYSYKMIEKLNDYAKQACNTTIYQTYTAKEFIDALLNRFHRYNPSQIQIDILTILNLYDEEFKKKVLDNKIFYATLDAIAGEYDQIEELIKNQRDIIDINSILRSGCWYNNLKLVQLAIKNGANVNHVDDDNQTPLAIASSLGFTEIVEELIKFGTNINQKLYDDEEETLWRLRNIRL